MSKQCDSLEEVCGSIEGIDDQNVKLLAERSIYVRQEAGFIDLEREVHAKRTADVE